MTSASFLAPEIESRELARRLRSGLVDDADEGVLPESRAWRLFLELRRRGEPDAARMLVSALRVLHTRRSMAGAALPTDDAQTDEHRLIEDPFAGELWKAYKKCIRTQRTGPAAQLLRDLEVHLCK